MVSLPREKKVKFYKQNPSLESSKNVNRNIEKAEPIESEI